MSFDVNVGRSQPMIRPAMNMANNGSSNGNCGYMNRQKKKKQSNSIFDTNHSFSSYTNCFVDEKKYMQEINNMKNSWIYKLYMFFQSFKQTAISKV